MALATLALAACEPAVPVASDFIPEYKGVETALLEGDLVQFNVAMTNALSRRDVANYAECAAAQYTLIRGYGFARHVRTNVDQEGGIWRGDAVYTISPSLPRGIKTIDAEVVAANCAEKGIPTV
ncbi:MAG: hypothetical protein AB8B60_18330 [Sulfitobacter sp.]